ncbi:MAG: extracellular solute-binding protein [Clostridia bacterium]|nr:extracellular solute-binding protein [Clostridia bacterium]
MRTKLSKALALFLALLMAMSSLSVLAFAADGTETAETKTSSRRTMAEWNEILNTSEYGDYLEKYTDLAPVTGTYTYYASESVDLEQSASGTYVDTANGSVYTPDAGKVVWNVNVPEEGLYTVIINCYPGNMELEDANEEMSTDVERILYINGKVPFSEARSLTITKRWAPEYKGADGRFETDKAGNDLRPDNFPAVDWTNYTVKDSAGYQSGALQFYFKEGENTIALEATREPMSVMSFTLAPAEELPTYEEYLAQHSDAKDASADAEPVIIEAELPKYQSDESIYPLTDRTSAVTSPQDPELQVLNFMGGSENFKTVGQWVEYEFEVAESGFYTIAMRSKQNDLSGMFASRTLYIDGEIPFAECEQLRFDYTSDWVCESLTDGTTEFKFYLTAGAHTLRFEVSLGQLAEVISTVESSLNNINDCYLDIMKLTGADPDEYRDYGFSRLMPDTITTMLKEAQNLYRVSDLLTTLCGEKGSQTATLDKVAFLLDKMGRDEDEIAPNLDNLKTYIGTLGTWLNNVRSQPVRMDYFVVQSPETEMPKANASFFEAIGFELQAFWASFFTDYSTMGAKDSGDEVTTSIEVWTTEGRDQAKILKNLVSSDFTQKTNVGVNVKLVAAGTLLPSVLSGQGPDAFLGAAGVDVINYAIRGAVEPLNDYEGFEQLIVNEFNASSVRPVTLYGTTYGIPERAGFYMMFVRIDILAELGLEIPETWDDLLAMLPVLQANNMSIGLNKEYDIFLYQMGGDRFADDGMRCGLDSNIALEAFEMYTRFFTDYSFPYTFDGPNRFRTGEMPILIADYSTTYNQLTVFATEINGLWEMVPLPGVYRDDGSYHNEAFNTVAATIMLHGTEDKASTWEFMRWYCGKDAQAAYGSDLVTTIGQAAKYNTANKEAIEEMPWTTSEKESLLSQFNNLSAVTNYPGAYIFARYLNFAILSVVNDGADPVVELQGYVSTINKEITRKREEFDLVTLENGKTLENSPEAKAAWDEWLAENTVDETWAAWLAGEDIPEDELKAWLALQD